MYCPKCGTQNPENAKVCLSCSQTLPVLPDAPQTGVKTSALAIWSFILAMIGLFTFMLTALPALICGIVGLVKINKSKGQLKGTGLAVAGIAIPVAGTVILPIFAILLAILMPALSKVRCTAKAFMCGTNLTGLGHALVNYAADHNDTYPPADSWCDLLVSNCDIDKTLFYCPADGSFEQLKGKSSYAININVVGKKISEVPPDIVLLFETDPAVNPVGGPDLLRTKKHSHGFDGCNVLFADGSVKFIKSEKLGTLRWTLE